MDSKISIDFIDKCFSTRTAVKFLNTRSIVYSDILIVHSDTLKRSNRKISQKN